MKSNFLPLATALTVAISSSAYATVVLTSDSVSDDFSGYTAGGADFQSQTTDWGAVGNQMQVDNVSNFSIAGAGSGQIIDAGTATSYAAYNGTASGAFTIGTNEQFVAEVLVAYTSTGFWGGLWFGNSNGSIYNSIQLGNTSAGTAGLNTGGVLLRNWNVGGTTTGATDSDSSNSTALNTWYRLTVSGTQGDSSVVVDVYDTANSSSIVSGVVLDLGSPIVDGSKVGFGTEASGAFKFDDFSVSIIPEPSSFALLAGVMGLFLLGARRRK